MHDNRDYGEDLLKADDYLSGPDDEPVIPRIEGFPRQRLSDLPADARVVRQRRADSE